MVDRLAKPTVPPRPGTAGPPDASGQLWQGPLFLVGTAALGFALLLRPGPGLTPAERGGQALTRALTCLEAGDGHQAAAVAREALDQPDLPPTLTGALHFALGTALLNTAPPVGPGRAEALRQAEAELRQANQLGVPPDYQPRIAYRLAKIAFLQGTDRTARAKVLEAALVDSPADRVEGYGLLLQLHLAEPPDWPAALRACDRLLAQAALANPNPIRLKRGEILVKLQKPEDARQILARIPANTPEFATARHLRALAFSHEENWTEAAKLWEEAVAAPGAAAGQLAEALYHLGLCYLEIPQKGNDACRVWERVLKEFPASPEAVAGGLALGEVYQKAGQDDEALKAYAAAIKAIQTPFRNPYLDLEAVRQGLEAAWGRWFDGGFHGPARALAQAYSPLAPPGVADLLEGRACQAGGQALQRQAEQTGGPQAETWIAQSRQLYADAAARFEHRAGVVSGAERADALSLAAENRLRAFQAERAVPLLEECLKIDLTGRKKAEVLVSLAEGLLRSPAKDPADKGRRAEQVLKLLDEAIPAMEPPAFRPRYWQAYAHIELGGLDANHYKTAENLLKDLALTPVTTGEPPELRQALSALGFVLQQQKKFTEAVSYYQKLLEQYPQDPNAVQVRFWMGESYLQAAQQEQEKLKQAGEKVQSDRFLKLKEAYLDKAVAQFGQVISTLVVLEHQRKLTAEEQELLRKGYFYQADCYSRQVGKADDAIRTYEGLVVLFGEKPEALLALAYLIECHARQDHRDQVQTTVLRARELLGKLKDNELQGTPRQTWEDWLHERARANAPQR